MNWGRGTSRFSLLAVSSCPCLQWDDCKADSSEVKKGKEKVRELLLILSYSQKLWWMLYSNFIVTFIVFMNFKIEINNATRRDMCF